jgi:hypothetical protein
MLASVTTMLDRSLVDQFFPVTRTRKSARGAPGCWKRVVHHSSCQATGTDTGPHNSLQRNDPVPYRSTPATISVRGLPLSPSVFGALPKDYTNAVHAGWDGLFRGSHRRRVRISAGANQVLFRILEPLRDGPDLLNKPLLVCRPYDGFRTLNGLKFPQLTKESRQPFVYADHATHQAAITHLNAFRL